MQAFRIDTISLEGIKLPDLTPGRLDLLQNAEMPTLRDANISVADITSDIEADLIPIDKAALENIVVDTTGFDIATQKLLHLLPSAAALIFVLFATDRIIKYAFGGGK